MAALTLATQAFALRTGLEHWRSMVFTVLTLVQMWQVMAIRSDRESLFQQGLWSNAPLLGAVVLTFMLQLAVLYIPFLNAIFDTSPLTCFRTGGMRRPVQPGLLCDRAGQVDRATRPFSPPPPGKQVNVTWRNPSPLATNQRTPREGLQTARSRSVPHWNLRQPTGGFGG